MSSNKKKKKKSGFTAPKREIQPQTVKNFFFS